MSKPHKNKKNKASSTKTDSTDDKIISEWKHLKSVLTLKISNN
jgi:hypothetical protein